MKQMKENKMSPLMFVNKTIKNQKNCYNSQPNCTHKWNPFHEFACTIPITGQKT